MEKSETGQGRNTSGSDDGAPDELLTLDEVATLLKLPKSWIYERTRRKLIPHVKLGKYLRFPRAALGRWLQGCGVGPPHAELETLAGEAPTRASQVGRPVRAVRPPSSR